MNSFCDSPRAVLFGGLFRSGVVAHARFRTWPRFTTEAQYATRGTNTEAQESNNRHQY